jgi:hypothetical protein
MWETRRTYEFVIVTNIVKVVRIENYTKKFITIRTTKDNDIKNSDDKNYLKMRVYKQRDFDKNSIAIYFEPGSYLKPIIDLCSYHEKGFISSQLTDCIAESGLLLHSYWYERIINKANKKKHSNIIRVLNDSINIPSTLCNIIREYLFEKFIRPLDKSDLGRDITMEMQIGKYQVASTITSFYDY